MQTSEQKEAFLHSWFDVPENVHWAHGMSNEVEKEVSESFDRAIAAMNTRPVAPVDGLETVHTQGRFDANDVWRNEVFVGERERITERRELVTRSQAVAIIALERAKAEEFADEIKEAAYEVWPEANDVGSDAPDIIRELGKERDACQTEAEDLKNKLYRAEADNAALTARVKELQEALRPFAEYGEDYFDKDNNGKPLPDEQGVGWIYMSFGQFRQARAALEGQP